jgi:hypothetical protein
VTKSVLYQRGEKMRIGQQRGMTLRVGCQVGDTNSSSSRRKGPEDEL